MTIFDAAAEVAAFLDGRGLPYAFIGGLAVQHWGEPRATQDVDVVVLVPSGKEEEFFKAAVEGFRPRLPNAVAFAQRHRMLLLCTSDGIPIDVSLGIPGYEEEVIRRALSVSLGGLRPVRIVTAEDLVVHKCVAGRARDVEDIERTLVRQRLKLDLRYIRTWLRAFEPIVESHDVRAVFERALRKARSALRWK